MSDFAPADAKQGPAGVEGCAPESICLAWAVGRRTAVAAVQDFGNHTASFTDEYVVNYNVRSCNAARIAGMSFSGPGADNLYSAGEVLDVTVEWSQAVTLS